MVFERWIQAGPRWTLGRKHSIHLSIIFWREVLLCRDLGFNIEDSAEKRIGYNGKEVDCIEKCLNSVFRDYPPTYMRVFKQEVSYGQI